MLFRSDSVYTRYDVQYVNNITTNQIFMTVISGSLPPGLQLLPNGIIVGYPEKPITTTGSYTTVTYNFTLQLESSLGNDTCNYSITVVNQDTNQLPKNRKPAILNIHPLQFPVSLDDPYYEFYIANGDSLPILFSGDNFAFKIIGYDFDNDQLTYNYTNLPTGLVGDVNTGWITGSVVLPTLGKNKYSFSVSVQKTINASLISSVMNLSLTVINSLTPTITWVTDSNLGTLNTASISELVIQAQSNTTLLYQVSNGTLPPNLQLLSTGEIVGRVPHQPSSDYMNLGDTVVYNFTVTAYSPSYHLISDSKDFTVTLYQSYQQPWENVYFKAYPSLNSKSILYSLLTNDSLLPPTSLYRPTDPYFGKASDVTCVHAYGMLISDINTYTQALEQIGRAHV